MVELKYLLDTSTCVELLRGNTTVRNHCILYNQNCCISIITAIELLYGAYRAPERYQAQEVAKAKMLTEFYTVVGIDEIAEPFSKEKVRLESLGQGIEDFDLLIGVTCRQHGLTVVTHNVRHFNRIDRLSVVDWCV